MNEPIEIGTGLTRFDEMIKGGIKPGELVIITGASQVGKSRLVEMMRREQLKKTNEPLCLESPEDWSRAVLAMKDCKNAVVDQLLDFSSVRSKDADTLSTHFTSTKARKIREDAFYLDMDDAQRWLNDAARQIKSVPEPVVSPAVAPKAKPSALCLALINRVVGS